MNKTIYCVFLYLLLLVFSVVKINVAVAFVITGNQLRNAAAETTAKMMKTADYLLILKQSRKGLEISL